MYASFHVAAAMVVGVLFFIFLHQEQSHQLTDKQTSERMRNGPLPEKSEQKMTCKFFSQIYWLHRLAGRAINAVNAENDSKMFDLVLLQYLPWPQKTFLWGCIDMNNRKDILTQPDNLSTQVNVRHFMGVY